MKVIISARMKEEKMIETYIEKLEKEVILLRNEVEKLRGEKKTLLSFLQKEEAAEKLHGWAIRPAGDGRYLRATKRINGQNYWLHLGRVENLSEEIILEKIKKYEERLG